MRRKFEDLRENLAEFVEQDDYPMMVVGCLADELAYVLKFFQGVQETHPEHVLLAFPQPFDSPHGYLDGVVESIRLQVEAAGPLRQERGEPPFPPLPPRLLSLEQTPADRFHGILAYLLSLLPNLDDHRLIVGFLPLLCTDWPGYHQLLASIVPHGQVPTWMKPLRLLGYDDRRTRHLLAAMQHQGIDLVLTLEVDFSTPALTDALSRDAANTELPVMERMACLFQLAALDYSYRRYADALQKYGVLDVYYAEQELPAMQALCLLGVGDTLRASGNPLLAKEKYQQGLALALQRQSLAALLNLLLAVSELCYELQHFVEAESYAESGTRVAAAVLNPYAYCDLHERWGDALLAQSKLAEAIEVYDKCRQLCRHYQYFVRWHAVLAKVIRIFRQVQWTERLHAAEQEEREVRVLERGGTVEQGASA